METFRGLEVWVYTAGAGQKGGYSYYNIWIILGLKSQFTFIRSPVAGKWLLFGSVRGYKRRVQLAEKEILCDEKAFLQHCIGTSDLRTKAGRQLLKDIEQFQADVMKQIIMRS